MQQAETQYKKRKNGNSVEIEFGKLMQRRPKENGRILIQLGRVLPP
jgi:hypothetical protein